MGGMNPIVLLFLVVSAVCGLVALVRSSDLQLRLQNMERLVSSLKDRLREAEDRLRELGSTATIEENISAASPPTVSEPPRRPTAEASVRRPETKLDQKPLPDRFDSPASIDGVPVQANPLANESINRQDKKPVEPLTPPTDLPRTPTSLDDPFERLKARIKNLGPNDPDMSWEMALGTYWLPRFGALAVSVVIVFLLTLALQRWGPPIRVGLGYLVSVTFLVAGWRFDRKYPGYARVLFAAGFALTYFVTFATYYVPFARLFDRPSPAQIPGRCS